MTFQDLVDVVDKITCRHLRARVDNVDDNFFKIVISSFTIDKDSEFLKERNCFCLIDDVIIPFYQLEKMDKQTVIETVRDKMLTIYMHEFNEFFKFDKITVRSPHISLE